LRIGFILPNLAIGGAINDCSAMDKCTVKGITHIINLDKECVSVDTIPTLHYYMHDDGLPKPDSYYISAVLFALEALKIKDAKLFVHCAAGRNRSVSITYAILRALEYSPQSAKELIKKNYIEPMEKRDTNFDRPKGIRYEQDVEKIIDKLKSFAKLVY